MESEQNTFYIVASNVLDSSKSKVISTISAPANLDEPDQDSISVDTSEFYGKGYGIYVTRKLDLTEESIDDLEDWLIYANWKGENTPFQIIRTLEEMILIEGSFTPGIYNIDDDFKYYEVANIDILFELLMSSLRQLNIENRKIFCSNDGYEVRAIDTNKTIYRVDRCSLNFFDVKCPFCSQKVVTHETDPNFYDCIIITTPCPHFAGTIISESGIYKITTFRTPKEDYEMVSNDLSIKTAQGVVKPFVLTHPSNTIESFWNIDSENGDSLEHYLFVDIG